MSMKINGIAQLMKKLDKINSLATAGAVMKGIQKSCLRVEKDAKKNCPVDTGILRASITHKLEPSTLSATVGSNVEYAATVEMGTQHKGSHAYLYPALRNNRDNIKQDITSALRDALRGL